MANKPTKPLTDSGEHVKVVPGKSVPAPKNASNPGLENRGAKPTKADKINDARTIQWNRAERVHDAALPEVGLRGGPNAKPRGQTGKNLRKAETIAKIASQQFPKEPIKIRTSTLKGRAIGNVGRMGGSGGIGGGGIDFKDANK